MAFTLPALAYAFNALEPYIDAMTMEIHHDRHHKAYVDNLNKAARMVMQICRPNPSRNCFAKSNRSRRTSDRP